MHRVLHAAAGALVLAAAVLVPASAASADSIRDQQWYLNSLKVPEAHGISKGAGITVALIDTGVYPHRDLEQNLLTGLDETTGKAGGQTDTVGHGTNMAGLIVANGRGSSGLLGMAPSAKLLPIRADKTGSISGDEIATGIDFAVANKARVISISIDSAPAFKLLAAVKAASEADVVIVAATGNSGFRNLGYPAAVKGVLAVGATDQTGKHWPDSNTGPNVQICAPGVGITTTDPGNKYVTAEGTSDSAAIAAGAVALVRAKFPQLSAAEVIHRITATADDIGAPGRDNDCGFGELNIVKALTADVPPLDGAGSPVSPSTPATTGGPTESASTGRAAPPTTEDKSSSGPLIVGVVVVVVLVAGLVGFVALRRRRS